MRLVRDVTYSTVIGYRPLTLDLYVPENPRAVCVFLHGGGWRRGTRNDGPGPMGIGNHHLQRIAERGICVASASYRLSGEARFPAQLDDVLAACEFVRTRGEEFAISALPLMLWGVSAGAHLALLASLSSHLDGKITAVASWSAPSDLLAIANDLELIGEKADEGMASREALLLGVPPTDAPDKARDASPFSQVHATSASILLVHGRADKNIPPQQTIRLAEAFRNVGASVELELVDGADHFFSTVEPDVVTATVDQTIDFLLQHA